jgi:hypothetical protein
MHEVLRVGCGNGLIDIVVWKRRTKPAGRKPLLALAFRTACSVDRTLRSDRNSDNQARLRRARIGFPQPVLSPRASGFP